MSCGSHAAITADTPIPFDLRSVWHTLDSENRETRSTKNDPSTALVIEPGSAEDLRPAAFQAYGLGSAAPFKSPLYDSYGTSPELLRLGLADPRLRFMHEATVSPDDPDPLPGIVSSWLGEDDPISVLDFNGVPAITTELATGVVLNLLFQVAIHSPASGPGVGRPRPILIVLEEAHRYLGTTAARLAKESANRIAREGRKYGVGLMLVTQRPSELPDTALAQCGTLIALRLSNATDQATVRAALPDSVSGLSSVLASLRTGEAVASGEAIALPARLLVDCPDPLPAAEDPSLAPWRQPRSQPELAAPVLAWRSTYSA
jgi:Helicase HerA-like C-terminal